MANFVFSYSVEPCSFVNLITASKGAGFEVVGPAKHPTKHICPVCRVEQSSRAGENANPEALRKAYTKAYLFKHQDGRRILACCAGHRQLCIDDTHPTFHKLEELVERGAMRVCRVELSPPVDKAPPPEEETPVDNTPKRVRCKGITTKGAQCALAAEANGFCKLHQNQATA